jgi:acyl-CoA reductase-like NAD-dependent aldehyde dehydrogenase
MTSPREIRARNPLTGAEDFTFACAGTEDVAAVCARLRAQQPAWQALGVEGRAAALRQLAAQFIEHPDSLREALQVDTGRMRIAEVELGAVQGMIALNLKHAEQWLGPMMNDTDWQPASQPQIVGRQQWVPYPLVGIIAPWNFPVVLSMIDAIPALLAGCAVLLKPSEVTPRYAEPLQKLFASVPELAGVVGVVLGDGATGSAVVDHVDAVVLTGSVATGRKVAEHAARRFIPAFLELGGKDAVIITEDADLDRAADAVLRASVLATGQACQSLERVLVHRSIFDALRQKLLDRLPAVRLTCDDPAGHIGPFIMARQAEIVAAQLSDAVAHGAKIEFGGQLRHAGGVWCEPTLVTGVTPTMRLMQEETFGPVIPLMAFDSLDEAIAMANGTDYGLSANVLAGSEEAALAIGERLEAGFISLNEISLSSQVMDFEWEGWKRSGLGRSRLGRSGIARYLQQKALVAHRGPAAPITWMTDR